MRSAHVLLLAAGLAAPPATADLYVSSFNSGGVYRFEDGTGQPVGTGVFIPPRSGGLALPRGLLRLADGTLLVAGAGTDEVLRYAPDGSYHSE
jgi:hypothetical protein